jgi:hypothetical protein
MLVLGLTCIALGAGALIVAAAQLAARTPV